jgi:excisionase family DNA binding protein
MLNRKALRVREVAAMFGVHEETIRRALTRGELAGAKLGVVWLIPVDAIDAWLSSASEESSDARRRQRVPSRERRRMVSAVVERPPRTSVIPDSLGENEGRGSPEARADESGSHGRFRPVEAEPWRLPPTLAR